jgi:hypothetical protein
MERSVVEVERLGDWMPVEELREAALKALGEGKDVTLNLKNVDHLDASALQILDYSGAVDQFFMIAEKNDE